MHRYVTYIVEVGLGENGYKVASVKVNQFGGDPTARSAAVRMFRGETTRIVAERDEGYSQYLYSPRAVECTQTREELINDGFIFLTNILNCIK
jgi:hypothetical protein